MVAQEQEKIGWLGISADPQDKRQGGQSKPPVEDADAKTDPHVMAAAHEVAVKLMARRAKIM
jgi:hypothetical protein